MHRVSEESGMSGGNEKARVALSRASPSKQSSASGE